LAYLLERNESADVAFLAMGDPELVTPLRTGHSPLVGENVWSYSPIFRARSSGSVTGWLGADWFETTQSVAEGWSGSPVLDARGDVVGVVSQCPAIASGATKRCAPGHVVVTGALCFRAD
jgi:S1-C subfamily serine protease